MPTTPIEPHHPAWIITVTGDCPVADLVADLRKAGLAVASVLAEIGVVSGQCTSVQATGLRKVAGVADMSPDAPVNPGPPD